MGVDAASSRTIGVKIRRSTSEWHNFWIHTLIDTLIAPVERYLCVEEHEMLQHQNDKVIPPKNVV